MAASSGLPTLYFSTSATYASTNFENSGTHDVDPFDGAATLSGIVEGAIHQVGDGEIEIRVFADQRRIFAAEFQAHVEQLRGGLLVDLAAAFDGAGKRDEIDGAAFE